MSVNSRKSNDLKQDIAAGNFEVKFYSGYKENEIPRCIIVKGRSYQIDEVLQQERIYDIQLKTMCDVFVCCINENLIKIKKFDTGECNLSCFCQFAGSNR
ncbi:MAG: hypothetical protein ACOC6P_01625 [Candidatus Aminicenantaceae bacterium]